MVGNMVRFRTRDFRCDQFFIDDERSSVHLDDLYSRVYKRASKFIDPIPTKLLIWKSKATEKKHIIFALFYLRTLTLCVDPNFTFFFSTIVCKDLPFIASSRCKYNFVQALFYALTGNTLVQLNDYKQAHGKTRSGNSHLTFWTRKKNERYFAKTKNWILLFAKNVDSSQHTRLCYENNRKVSKTNGSLPLFSLYK